MSLGQTALFCAIGGGHIRLVMELLNTPGTNVNIPCTPDAITPLHGKPPSHQSKLISETAAVMSSTEIVALLIAKGANQQAKTKAGLTARAAAETSSRDVSTFLPFSLNSHAFRLW